MEAEIDYKIGALILAGGTSRRMGHPKETLPFCGTDFLRVISSRFQNYDELLLSVQSKTGRELPGLTEVADQFPGCGPLSGLHAGLCACKSDYLLAVACDMPLFPAGLADYLAAFVSDKFDAFLPVNRGGRLCPLGGIYAKSAGAVFQTRLEAGDFRLTSALACLRVKKISLAHSAYPDEALTNINTPDEYAALCQHRKSPPIVAVCGVKNSGKTTFISALLPRLCDKGLRVAVIKHDGHDFVPDCPDTDSFRLYAAGADGVAVFSRRHWQLTRRQPDVTVEMLASRFDDVDLILLEGGKHSVYPKIELVRTSVSCAPVSSPDTLLAVCTDGLAVPHGVFRLELTAYDEATELLLRFLSVAPNQAPLTAISSNGGARAAEK